MHSDSILSELMRDSQKIGTFNVRGLRERNKRKQVFAFIWERGFDIMLLQETHCAKNDEVFWRTQAGGQMYFANSKSNKGGVAIWISRKYSNYHFISQKKDPMGRWIAIEIGTDSGKIRLVSIYAPNEDTPEFFRNLGKELIEYEGNQIVGGDFNLVQDFQLDTWDRVSQGNIKLARILDQIKQEKQLIDVFRLQNPFAKKYSCIRHKENKGITSFSRIDFMLISIDLLLNVPNSDILPGFKSDHAIPYFVLKHDKAPRGPGFWKLNNSILRDTEYKENMIKLLREEKAKKYTDVFQKWLCMKGAVAGYSIKYSSQKKKSQINKYNVIDRKIEYWIEKSHSGKDSEHPIINSKIEILKHIVKLQQEKEELVNHSQRRSHKSQKKLVLVWREINVQIFLPVGKK